MSDGQIDMTVLHVDANSAYLSWTAVNLLESGYGVDIREVPSVIAGDPAERHGIILAKSIPAKKLGITTAVSLYEAREKCPSLLVFPPDYDLYMSCSNAMYDILCGYSSLIQRYSVDECFVGFTPQMIGAKDPVETAYEIKEKIKKELGFTVNIGVGSNKLLAKMACELKKPDRVHTLLTQEEIETKMHPLPVGELFMVGRATTRKLNQINVKTIGDLAACDPGLLKALLKSHGLLIHRYANGIDDDAIIPNNKIPEKSIGNGMTARYDVTDEEEALMYILSLTERVGMRVRKRGYKGDLIGIYVCTKDFVYYSHQMKLAFFTDDTNEIYRYAAELFRECWRHEPIRKLGVRVGGLSPRNECQLSIFDPRDMLKGEALSAAVDAVRKRYGDPAVFRGTFANTGVRPLEGGVHDGNYLMMGGVYCENSRKTG